MAAENVDLLLTNESSDDDSKDDKDDASVQYYNHESGPFSKNDGSYRHRNELSPRPHTLKPPPGIGGMKGKRMKYSWSTPDFSIYSSAKSKRQNGRINAKPVREPSFTELAAMYWDPEMIRSIIQADVPLFPKSFVLCPHKHHCFQNAIMKGFFRTFSAAFIFKTSLSFFTSLLSRKLSFAKIKKIYLNEDSILFGLFCGLMSFTYKAILCILRRVRKKDPIYHKTIAGFLSATWILMDNKQRRRQIALYCFVRALSDLVKLGVEYRKVPAIPHADIGIFTFSQLFVMHGLVHHTDTLDPNYYKWIKRMGGLNEQQCQLSFRSRIDPKCGYRLPGEEWRPCYYDYGPGKVFHHDHSCVQAQLKDWCWGIGRAMQIYIPVHFLPMILFQPKKVIADPVSFLKRKGYNLAVSSVFLTTYQFNMKLTNCLLRNWSQSDEPWYPAAGGLMSGLSLFLESPFRRPELMLYCVPRAMEVAMRLIPNRDQFSVIYKALRSSACSCVSFQIAMSVWMTVIAIPKGVETSNSINMTVIKILFGSKH